MKRVLKIIFIISIVALIGYGVLTCYVNFGPSSSKTLEEPKIEKASYQVTVQSTGISIFTDKYEKKGTVYILHGYWELIGQKYVYRKTDLLLDELTFGRITLRRR